MKNINLRIVLSAACLMSIVAAFTKVEASPLRFDQVVQTLNARPGQAETGNFARLSVANYPDGFVVGDGDDDNKKKDAQPQDGRVITETKTDIVEDDVCDCVEDVAVGGFPKWALLGLIAIPIAFILIKRKKTPTPTPTPTTPTTPTPTPGTPTPTPTPGTPTPTPTPGTPTPTPTTPTPTPTPGTPTPTPPITPTPTPPQTVPEPITILLFGTGLASIGLAARRRFGKRDKKEGEEEN